MIANRDRLAYPYPPRIPHDSSHLVVNSQASLANFRARSVDALDISQYILWMDFLICFRALRVPADFHQGWVYERVLGCGGFSRSIGILVLVYWLVGCCLVGLLFCCTEWASRRLVVDLNPRCLITRWVAFQLVLFHVWGEWGSGAL